MQQRDQRSLCAQKRRRSLGAGYAFARSLGSRPGSSEAAALAALCLREGIQNTKYKDRQKTRSCAAAEAWREKEGGQTRDEAAGESIAIAAGRTDGWMEWMERGIAKSSEWSKERRGKLEKKKLKKNLFFHINYADVGAPCAAWDVCSKQRGAQLERPPPPTQQPPFLFLLSCRIASTELAVRSLLLHNFVSHKLYVLHLLPSYSLSFYKQTTAVIINNKRECWQECIEHRHREKEREREKERGKRRYMFIYLSISPYIWWLEVDFVLTYFVVKRGERALSLRVSFPHNCCQLGQPSPRGRGRGRIPLAGEAANTESPPSEAPLRGERRRTEGEEARRLVRV